MALTLAHRVLRAQGVDPASVPTPVCNANPRGRHTRGRHPRQSQAHLYLTETGADDAEYEAWGVPPEF